MVAVAIAVGVFSGWQINGDSSRSETTSSSPTNVTAVEATVASWLFSHTSSDGEIRTNSEGSLELVLRKFDPHVTAFTDRPFRDARIETVEWLVHSWSDLFTDNPPNAVLVEHDPKGEAQSVVVELFRPILTNRELRFIVKVIEAEAGSDIAEMAGTPHVDPVRKFEAVSLFIDDVSLSCAQGGVCVVGDKGPGGGVVFYASKWNFTSEVSDCVSSCRYLEAAPSDVGDPVEWDTAMPTALDYTSNGLSDWYLPTKDDLNEMYVQRGKVGGLAKDYYWSSSMSAPGSAHMQYFNGGKRSIATYSSLYRVRPIRAFS